MRITFRPKKAGKTAAAGIFLSIVGFMSTPPVLAETVVIFDRYFADRTTIHGSFFKNENEPITLRIYIGQNLYSKEIICPEHEWD